MLLKVILLIIRIRLAIFSIHSVYVLTCMLTNLTHVRGTHIQSRWLRAEKRHSALRNMDILFGFMTFSLLFKTGAYSTTTIKNEC